MWTSIAHGGVGGRDDTIAAVSIRLDPATQARLNRLRADVKAVSGVVPLEDLLTWIEDPEDNRLELEGWQLELLRQHFPDRSSSKPPPT